MSQGRRDSAGAGAAATGDTPAPEVRVRFGARSRGRAVSRDGGPPGPAELLSDLLQEECEPLRSALEIALARIAHRAVMITSAIPESGSTTIATALAFNLAVRGSARVLLIDANVRRPAIHRVFALPFEEGLTRVLARRTDPATAIVSTPFPGLSVMPVGDDSLLPAHLFGADGVSGLIAHLKEHYDYILVDTPALLSMPESAILGGEADGVVIVARADRTKRETLIRARQILERSGSNLLGVVLNGRRYFIPSMVYKRV
jgi:capsular exopolysaccharide synthesis family protein